MFHVFSQDVRIGGEQVARRDAIAGIKRFSRKTWHCSQDCGAPFVLWAPGLFHASSGGAAGGRGHEARESTARAGATNRACPELDQLLRLADAEGPSRPSLHQ